jgi:hypothetical protein
MRGRISALTVINDLRSDSPCVLFLLSSHELTGQLRLQASTGPARGGRIAAALADV